MPTVLPETSPITGYECKHVYYCQPKDWSIPDMHLVKEVIHHEDGTTTPTIRLIKDYKRSVWIDRQHNNPRAYKEKKERQKKDQLIEYKTTQRNLVNTIAKGLGTPWVKGSLKQLCSSPYVYGADIVSTAVIKRSYQDRFPKAQSPSTVCALDIETDMIWGTKEVLMCTVAMGKKAYLVIQKKFLVGHINVEEQLQKMFLDYLGERMVKDPKTMIDEMQPRNFNLKIALVDSPEEVVVMSLRKVHEWQPDFLSIWNIDFDIPQMVKALEDANIDPALIFSDPRVPDAYKFYWYKKGQTTKVMESGKVMPLPWYEQWHTVQTPASFFVVDAACAYRGIRNQKQKETSYALDYILKKEIGHGKLKFEQADHVSGGDWHVLMQSEFKLEYCIYNTYDVIGLLELDDKTQDLRLSMPTSSGCSDYQHFRSQPRRLVNEFHYELLDQGYVIGTTAKEMKTELDEFVISTKDWIIALPAYLICENGLKVILDGESIKTTMYGHTADLDVSAAYPTNEVTMNVSKETTSKELCSIEGVDERTRRAQGLNLSGGHTNAVEFCVNMFHLPDWDVMLEAYEVELEPVAELLAA